MKIIITKVLTSLLLISGIFQNANAGSYYLADGYITVMQGRAQMNNGILEYCTSDWALFNKPCETWVNVNEYIEHKTGRKDLEYIGLEAIFREDDPGVVLYYKVKK